MVENFVASQNIWAFWQEILFNRRCIKRVNVNQMLNRRSIKRVNVNQMEKY
jgi:hypothetical protein